MLLHYDDKEQLSARAVVIPKGSRQERLPRYFTDEESIRIIQPLSERDQLIVLWALYTGARQHEIVALIVSQLPSVGETRARPVVRVSLDVSKGSKGGDLFAPRWLIDRTFQYMKLFDRTALKRDALRRGVVAADNIFLSNRFGQLSTNTVYRMFKSAVKCAGLSGTFHDLRHTYAISMLDKLMRAAMKNENEDGRNPLLILKSLLRHSSLQTTERYLVAREFYLTDIMSDAWELPM